MQDKTITSTPNLFSSQDWLEVYQLSAKYCHFIRAKDVDALLGLFAQDGILRASGGMGPGGERRGHTELRDTFEQQLGKLDPWPFIHNQVVEILGSDHGKGGCHAEFRLGSRGFEVAHLGVYEDEFVKEASVWKFSLRNLITVPIDA